MTTDKLAAEMYNFYENSKLAEFPPWTSLRDSDPRRLFWLKLASRITMLFCVREKTDTDWCAEAMEAVDKGGTSG